MGITRTLLTKLFVLAFAASTATWALAQGPRFGDPHGPGGPVGGVAPLAMLLLDPQVYGGLGLTPEQQALWTALQTAEQAARAQRDAGRTTVQALVASEFAGGAPNLVDIEEAIVAQLQTMASGAAAVSTQAVTLYSSLNTGQQAIVETIAMARYGQMHRR